MAFSLRQHGTFPFVGHFIALQGDKMTYKGKEIRGLRKP